MNRKILLWLFGGYCVTAFLALTLLRISFHRGAIAFRHADSVAGPIILSIAALVGLLLLFFVIGIGVYVYHDAKRRGMEPVVWTLVAVFIPYFIGLIVYLVTRKPLQSTCPSCGMGAPWKASFCPSCGRPISRACPKCQASIQNGARFCHSCGLELSKG